MICFFECNRNWLRATSKVIHTHLADEDTKPCQCLPNTLLHLTEWPAEVFYDLRENVFKTKNRFNYITDQIKRHRHIYKKNKQDIKASKLSGTTNKRRTRCHEFKMNTTFVEIRAKNLNANSNFLKNRKYSLENVVSKIIFCKTKWNKINENEIKIDLNKQFWRVFLWWYLLDIIISVNHCKYFN